MLKGKYIYTLDKITIPVTLRSPIKYLCNVYTEGKDHGFFIIKDEPTLLNKTFFENKNVYQNIYNDIRHNISMNVDNYYSNTNYFNTIHIKKAPFTYVHRLHRGVRRGCIRCAYT